MTRSYVKVSLRPADRDTFRELAAACGVRPAPLARALVLGEPELVPLANRSAEAELAKLQGLLTQTARHLVEQPSSDLELAELRDQVERALVLYRRALLGLGDDREST